VRAKKPRAKPYVPKPEGDPSRVRHGFFTREEVQALCTHLDADLADVVMFLFFAAWRIGEVRTVQWRDYDRREQTIRLRPEHRLDVRLLFACPCRRLDPWVEHASRDA
jgi:integrase